MGNRAIIASDNRNFGVYLHWNGGYDSVSAFLEYCKLKGYSSFETDYGMARFIQVVSNFFGGGHSIGVIPFNGDSDAEDVDNGIYYVKGWEIERRVFTAEEQRSYSMMDMLKKIDNSQPENERLGKGFLKGTLKPVGDLKLNEIVWVFDLLTCKYDDCKVIGFGKDKMVNGTNVKGIPYVDKYGFDPENNINNYLTEDSYRTVYFGE